MRFGGREGVPGEKPGAGRRLQRSSAGGIPSESADGAQAGLRRMRRGVRGAPQQNDVLARVPVPLEGAKRHALGKDALSSAPITRVRHVREVGAAGSFVLIGGWPAWYLHRVLRDYPGGLERLLARSGVGPEKRIAVEGCRGFRPVGARWLDLEGVAPRFRMASVLGSVLAVAPKLLQAEAPESSDPTQRGLVGHVGREGPEPSRLQPRVPLPRRVRS
jgi:hypothetical protein